ncbi:hypothetical protein GOQ04_03200 [Emticicia sp. ODNR4P]|nr:hypothetical protein [Emticicia sp. ODNR4P]
MKGAKNTLTVELKDEVEKLKKKLPKGWVRKYIETFHSNTKGVKVVEVYIRLENIRKGIVAPTLSELKSIQSLTTVKC